MLPRLRYLTGIGIGEKLLLAVDLKGFDGVLPLGRQDPVDECLALVLFHVRMFGRVDQDDAVLIEQLVVAFHHDLVVAALLEARQVARSVNT